VISVAIKTDKPKPVKIMPILKFGLTCTLGCSECNGKKNINFIFTSNSKTKLSLHIRINLVKFQPDCDVS